jgi:hypothetical protein
VLRRNGENPGKKGVGIDMANEMITCTEESVTLRADVPKPVGTKMDVEVRLPKGILIKSFLLNGTITACECAREAGSGRYVLKMKIGSLSPMNQKILEAYKDFLERERMLKEIKIDMQAFQEAFDTFGKKLRQLRKTAEEVKDSVRGTLELMKRNAQDKPTIH